MGVGLVSSWIFVVSLYPILFQGTVRIRSTVINSVAASFRSLWVGLSPISTSALLCAILSIGILVTSNNLRINQNLSNLVKSNETLIRNDHRVASLVPGFSPTLYLLIQRESLEQSLEAVEEIRPKLETMRETGELGDFLLLSDFFSCAVVIPRNKRPTNQYLF